ncbi:MAG TPA: FtsX-like permease family protein [Bryobacteraceae bacterium]|nr:FtsX-like permease family protein [Bryobacteraceae bacterium]
MLGKGGMGEVYRTDDLTLGQPVALKFPPEAIAGNESALGRFRYEVRTARQVSPPNVCRVYDVDAVEEGSGCEMYIPVRQCEDYASVDLVVRTALPPAGLASAVRAALKPIEPNLPGNEFRILQDLVDKAVSPRRFVVLLLAGFAGFALILASLGIYAVISYSVTQRTQEIGIRMALGASAADLRAQILGQTMSLAAIGMVIGIVASWILARTISSLLFGITATDPVTFIGMLVVLTVVAAIAGYVPARRASRIDPMVALRAS